MGTHASIRDRPMWMVGRRRLLGWATDAPDPAARLVPFGFDITDDGAGHYLLVLYSMDRSYWGDTRHETLADAYATAEESFGIQPEEWGQAENS